MGIVSWKGVRDQRLAPPRQNNLQTGAHCLNRGVLFKTVVFCIFQQERGGMGLRGGGWRGRERHRGVRWAGGRRGR
jgi:hypothetical protein